MKDPLKTFIEQHRDEFDNATPDDALVERTAYKLSSHQPERNASRIPAMRLQLLERQHDIIQDIKRNKNPRS